MLRSHLSALFLIVYIPNTFCLFNDTVGAGELLRRIVKRLSTIDGSNITAETYPQAVMLVHEFIGELKELHSYVVPMSEFDEPALDDSSIYERFRKEQEIRDFIGMVDDKLWEFIMFLEDNDIPSESWEELAQTISRDSEDRPHIISSETLLSGIRFGEGGLFQMIANRVANKTTNQCGRGQEVQNFFIAVYKMVILSEIERGLMTTWAHVYLYGAAGINRGRFSSARSKRLLKHSYALLNSLEAVSAPYFRYCDPHYNSWIRGISYIELNGFIQEVIFKYRDLFCGKSCGDMWHEKRCKAEWFDTRSSCHGKITSCSQLGNIQACASKQGTRKYEWVDSSQYGVQGRNHASCPANIGYPIKVRTWSMSSSCHCHCLEKDWTVYLGLLESAARDNNVITGVRFTLKDNMLFLQPAQGKLNANGYIDVVGWVTLPDVVSEIDIGRLDLDHRSFFFDDLQLGPEYALTGIKFDAVERGQGTQVKGFGITITGWPLDYRTGRLDMTPANKRVIRVPSSGIEKELIYKPVRPLDTEIFELQEPSSDEFTYVTLQQSELADDFGQSTLPLFDSTPVVMERHSPLSGISVFHKGSKDNAGFISVRVRPINYVPFVEALIQLYKANVTEV